MITILQLAEHRGVEKEENGCITQEAFNKVGLEVMGGCLDCGASIAAYNAYPSRRGFWKCGECICDDGWETCEEYERDFNEAERLASLEQDDPPPGTNSRL